MSQRTTVVGASGRLRQLLCQEFASASHQVTALSRAHLDITNDTEVIRVVAAGQPHVVVNCAAYNAVDAAETNAESAFAVNGHAAGVLAAAANAAGAVFIHFGTDFVFDGLTPKPYTEEDTPNPSSIYGLSKLAGETEVRKLAPRHYILRVASLFGGTGVRGHRATIDYIIETLIAGGTVRALVNRTVSPSYVPDVGRALCAIIDTPIPFGTYHCVNSDSATWYDLAQFVARELHVSGRVEPIQVASLTSVAPRPQFCALSNEKLRQAGIEIPDWRSAISRHIHQRVDSVATP